VIASSKAIEVAGSAEDVIDSSLYGADRCRQLSKRNSSTGLPNNSGEARDDLLLTLAPFEHHRD
jgi:hypothetical protein